MTHVTLQQFGDTFSFLLYLFIDTVESGNLKPNIVSHFHG